MNNYKNLLTEQCDNDRNWLDTFLNQAKQDSDTKSDLMTQSLEIKSRADTCGTPLHGKVNEKGELHKKYIVCNDYRNCQNCAERRVDHFAINEVERLGELCTEFFGMIVSKKQMGAFNYARRKLDAQYIKVPMGGEEFVIFVDAKEMCDVKKLNFKPVDPQTVETTLDAYVIIPEGTRITGKLFRPYGWMEEKEEEEIENAMDVSCSQFVSDADDNSVENARQEGLAEVTEILTEVTANNVQQANNILIGVMQRVLVNKGFYVQKQGYRNYQINANAISWPKVQLKRTKSNYTIVSSNKVTVEDKIYDSQQQLLSRV